MTLTRVQYCILGAGPSGLSFARALMRAGEDSFVVLEAEEEAGGLCRSAVVDGAPLDIGGGHFLDPRRKEAVKFLFELMPESEWNRYERVASILLRDAEVDHPLEANLWQLPIGEQVEFLESIARAGCVSGAPEPRRFDDWIRWKLGDLIADEYMLPYNAKMWCMPTEEIGTYWLHKLPSVSFRETLLSCIKREATGQLPAHGEFFYPKNFGYGEVWRRMGESLGDRLWLGCPVTSIDPQRGLVNQTISAKAIVNTIPWPVWLEIGAIPSELEHDVRRLRRASIDVDYCSESTKSDAHWLYEPSATVSYHRILARHNFVPGARGHWTETNSKRSGVASGFRHHNPYAYPINTVGKRRAVSTIARWARGQNVEPLGRWGHWEHMNSDVAVQQALEAARDVLRR